MFALDANAVIHSLQGKGRVCERLTAISPELITIPAPALYEVERGILRSEHQARRRRAFSAIFASCPLLPFDEMAARTADKIREDLESRRLMIGPIDILIAATALAHGAILVTHKVREFERVPGLVVEDWFD